MATARQGTVERRRRLWPQWAMVGVLLLAAATRLHDLGHRSLWGDELWTVSAAAEPTIAAMVENLSAYHQLPISTVFFATRFSADLAWHTPARDLFARLPTALAGILGVALTFALGRILLGRRPGLLAALLLATSGFHVRHSQIARYYAIYMTLAALALYLFWRARRDKHWPWWLGYSLACIAAAYTHLFAIFVPVVCSIYSLSLSVARIAAVPSGLERRTVLREERQALVPVVLSGLAILVAWTPVIPMILRFWSSPSGAGSGAPSIKLSPQLFVDLVAGFSEDKSGNSSLWVLGPLFVVGLILLTRRSGRKAWFAGLLFLVPVLVLWIIQPGHRFGAEYVIFQLPMFLLIVAYGITGLSQDRTRLSQPARFLSYLLVALLILSAFLASFLATARWYATPTENWKAAATYLEAALEPDDLVVCDGQLLGQGGDGPRARVGLQLYLDNLPHNVQVIRERQARAALPQRPEVPRRMWGVLWHQEPLAWEPDPTWAVTQFEEVTLIRLANREPRPAREEMVALLVALVKMQPLPEGKTDLLLAMESISVCTPDKAAPQHGVPDETTAAIAAECASLGQGYQLAEQLERAERYYRQARALAPNNSFYLLRLGDLYARQDRVDEARAAYQGVLALSPGDEEALKKLARLEP